MSVETLQESLARFNRAKETAAYLVVRRPLGEAEWSDVGLCFESMTVLTDQPQGIQLEYQVIAVNKAGDSLPSNLITVAL